MFKGLQNKWKVSGLQLTLILITFAVGGSLTGYAGRKLLGLLNIDRGWLWLIAYIFIIIILWPIAVILISLLTGQSPFFIKYIKRMGVRMKIISGQTNAPTKNSALATIDLPTGRQALDYKLSIFASGAGSNAQKIIDHFRNSPSVKIGLIVCNNPNAGVLKIAEKESIPCIIIEKERFFRGDHYINELKEKNIGLVVLAGFLWKLPPALIAAWPRRIVNIHPALLPNYGGKGMYGNSVHAAVIAAGEKESGITIHYVDEHYDNGDIIFQAKCPVLPDDTPDSLAQRIHRLEHDFYPKVIEELVDQLVS